MLTKKISRAIAAATSVALALTVIPSAAALEPSGEMQSNIAVLSDTEESTSNMPAALPDGAQPRIPSGDDDDEKVDAPYLRRCVQDLRVTYSDSKTATKPPVPEEDLVNWHLVEGDANKGSRGKFINLWYRMQDVYSDRLDCIIDIAGRIQDGVTVKADPDDSIRRVYDQKYDETIWHTRNETMSLGAQRRGGWRPWGKSWEPVRSRHTLFFSKWSTPSDISIVDIKLSYGRDWNLERQGWKYAPVLTSDNWPRQSVLPYNRGVYVEKRREHEYDYPTIPVMWNLAANKDEDAPDIFIYYQHKRGYQPR